MHVIIVPCNFDNYSYLVVNEQTRTCAVVDPCEYYPVAAAIKKNNLDLISILCTHHHRDHIEGLEDLQAEHSDLHVYAHASDEGRIAGVTDLLEDGDRLQVGELEATLYHTPGHTRGSCVYHFEGALFTGDTLFGGGCGRLFEGSAEEMYHSLTRITELIPPQTKIYPGHEYTLSNLEFAHHLEPNNQAVLKRLNLEKDKKAQNACTPDFDLALEKLTNPFLRCDDPELRSGVEKIQNGIGESAAELFGTVRAMKDNF